jgi:choline monooxygenase
MLDQKKVAAEIAAMEREAKRQEYPATFPVLPEIPGGRYADEEFYELELKHVWRKTWLYAGHTSEVPERGSYKLFEKLGVTIIIVRSQDGQIRAHHNVCRHRGARLVTESPGKNSKFVCPYHAWSYGLDGRLAVVPGEHNFGCLDKAKRGLLPVRCETWKGLIFINLDPSAAGLAEHMAPVAAKIGDYPLDSMSVKRSASIPMNCNWKASVDNFIEIYHLPVVHGKTAMQWLRSETFNVSMLKNGHSFLSVERVVNTKPGEPELAKLLHGPLPKDAPIVPGVDEFFDAYSCVATTFPNLNFGGFNPGGFPLTLQWPDGPGKCVMEVVVLGWSESDESLPYWDTMMADTMVQVEEDIGILSEMQKALGSGYYMGSLVGYLERAIYWYNQEIDRRIGLGNIPPHLRMERVLEYQVDA